MRQPICRRLHPSSRAGFCICHCWRGLFGATPSASTRCVGLIRLFSKDSSRERPEQSRTPRMTELRISVADTIDAVDAHEWDACANPGARAGIANEGATRTERPAAHSSAAAEPAYNPFISHAFLAALEQSNSVGRRTGWQPGHVLVRTTKGTLVAGAACF